MKFLQCTERHVFRSELKDEEREILSHYLRDFPKDALDEVPAYALYSLLRHASRMQPMIRSVVYGLSPKHDFFY